MKISGLYEVYFSPTGHTKKVIDVFSKAWNIPRTKVDLTNMNVEFDKFDIYDDDLCVFAVPSYCGRVPVTATQRIKQMKGNNTPAIIITTYGNRHYEDTLCELQDVIESKGFYVVAALAVPTEHSIVPEIAQGRIDEEDSAKLLTMAVAVREYIAEKNGFNFAKLKGNDTYRELKNMELIPSVAGKCIDCGVCAINCPVGAIPLDDTKETDETRCISCMRCVTYCPAKARIMPKAKISAIASKLKKDCEERKEIEIFINSNTGNTMTAMEAKKMKKNTAPVVSNVPSIGENSVSQMGNNIMSEAGDISMNDIPTAGMLNTMNDIPTAGMLNTMNDMPPVGMPNTMNDMPPVGMPNTMNDMPPVGMSNIMNDMPPVGMPNTMNDMPPVGMSNIMNDMPPVGMSNIMNDMPPVDMSNTVKDISNMQGETKVSMVEGTMPEMEELPQLEMPSMIDNMEAPMVGETMPEMEELPQLEMPSMIDNMEAPMVGETMPEMEELPQLEMPSMIDNMEAPMAGETMPEMEELPQLEMPSMIDNMEAPMAGETMPEMEELPQLEMPSMIDNMEAPMAGETMPEMEELPQLEMPSMIDNMEAPMAGETMPEMEDISQLEIPSIIANSEEDKKLGDFGAFDDLVLDPIPEPRKFNVNNIVDNKSTATIDDVPEFEINGAPEVEGPIKIEIPQDKILPPPVSTDDEKQEEKVQTVNIEESKQEEKLKPEEQKQEPHLMMDIKPGLQTVPEHGLGDVVGTGLGDVPKVGLGMSADSVGLPSLDELKVEPKQEEAKTSFELKMGDLVDIVSSTDDVSLMDIESEKISLIKDEDNDGVDDDLLTPSQAADLMKLEDIVPTQKVEEKKNDVKQVDSMADSLFDF